MPDRDEIMQFVRKNHCRECEGMCGGDETMEAICYSFKEEVERIEEDES